MLLLLFSTLEQGMGLSWEASAVPTCNMSEDYNDGMLQSVWWISGINLNNNKLRYKFPTSTCKWIVSIVLE